MQLIASVVPLFSQTEKKLCSFKLAEKMNKLDHHIFRFYYEIGVKAYRTEFIASKRNSITNWAMEE